MNLAQHLLHALCMRVRQEGKPPRSSGGVAHDCALVNLAELRHIVSQAVYSVSVYVAMVMGMVAGQRVQLTGELRTAKALDTNRHTFSRLPIQTANKHLAAWCAERVRSVIVEEKRQGGTRETEVHCDQFYTCLRDLRCELVLGCGARVRSYE